MTGALLARGGAGDRANSSSNNYARELFVAKFWYFFFSGALAFYLPYVPLFMRRDLGWQPVHVGLVQGLRPWVSTPCSLLLCSLADRFRAHRFVLLFCFAASTLLRGALALVPPSFGAIAGLILVSDALAAPVPVIADASVVAKCVRDGDYGKQRVWASIGWGGLAVVSGALIMHTSVRWGFLVFVCLSAPNLAAAWLLNPGPRRPPVAVEEEPEPQQQSQHQQQQLAGKGDSTAKVGPGSCDGAPRDLIAAVRGGAALACDSAAAAAQPAWQQPQPQPQQPPRPPCSEGDASSCTSTPRSTAALLGGGGGGAFGSSSGSGLAHALRRAALLQDGGGSGGAAVAAAHVAESLASLDEGCKEGGDDGDDDEEIEQDGVNVHAAVVARAACINADAFLPPKATAEAADVASAAAAPPPPATARELLLRPRVLVFLFRALVTGYGVGTAVSFAFLLVREMGGRELLMGVMLLCTVLTEAPAFQFQATLLKRVPVPLVINASMAVLAGRLALYSLLPRAPSPWAVLPVELLHGVSFATAWGAGIVHCKRVAPPALATTMQSVYSALFVGAGPGIGGLTGGVAMQRFGAARMFLIAAGVVLSGTALACALDALVSLLERHQRRRAAAAAAAAAAAPGLAPFLVAPPPQPHGAGGGSNGGAAPGAHRAPSLARRSLSRLSAYLSSHHPLHHLHLHGGGGLPAFPGWGGGHARRRPHAERAEQQ